MLTLLADDMVFIVLGRPPFGKKEFYNSDTIKSQNVFYAAQANGAVSHIDIRDIATSAR